MNRGAAEPWFHNAVIDGVQRLYALNLADRPAAEVLTLTAITWVEVLWSMTQWDELQDARRLPVAFTRLAAVVDRWPAPNALREHLPSRRREVPQLTHAGTPPPASFKDWLANRRGANRAASGQTLSSVSGNMRTAENQVDADTAGAGTE